LFENPKGLEDPSGLDYAKRFESSNKADLVFMEKPPTLVKREKGEERPFPFWFWLALGGGGLIVILVIFIYLLTQFFKPTHLRSTSSQAPLIYTLLPTNSQVQTTQVPFLVNTPVTTTAGSLPNSITDSKGVTMAFIPAGPFQMGSINNDSDEEPIHTVILDAFYMDIYQVTNARYKECVHAGVCQAPSHTDSYTRNPYYGSSHYDNFPVLYVSWNNALAYCQWRGAQLPTEAEWEKAARGKLEGKFYPWGNEDPTCTLGANNGAQLKGCIPNDTVAVGSFAPNGYGLYDMAGNVFEWVMDWYDANYYASSPENNPTGPSSGYYRVLRGGSFGNEAIYLQAAYRVKGNPDFRSYAVGFRCSR
jgi:formylglycine-generating enzyme required for sulfatase activity